MLRRKTALAALGAATALFTLTPSFADEPKISDTQLVAQPRDTADGTEPGIRVTSEKPEDASLVNGRNGKVVTLEMVQKDAEWRAETAEMLEQDKASEPTR